MSRTSQVMVKKVSPFPIEATLEIGGQQVPALIKKMNNLGVIAHLGQAIVRAGHEGQIKFQIPVLKASIQSKVKVIKTYDQLREPTQDNPHRLERLAEFHFLDLTEDSKNVISQFLKKIGLGK